MAVGTAFDCGTLPTWVATQCCQGCHGTTNDVRPTRAHFVLGYPIGATVKTVAEGSTKVMCCRSQLHAVLAMAATPLIALDALTLAAEPVPIPSNLTHTPEPYATMEGRL